MVRHTQSHQHPRPTRPLALPGHADLVQGCTFGGKAGRPERKLLRLAPQPTPPARRRDAGDEVSIHP